MARNIYFFLVVIIFTIPNLFSQEIPDCMCPPLSHPPTGQRINSDSAIVLDTCGIWFPSLNCDQAWWNNISSEYQEGTVGRYYSKGNWSILFYVDALPIPAASPDTVIIVDWTEIDTSFHEIREAFQLLEEKFGDFYLQKAFPTAEVGNPSRIFKLYFPDYVNIFKVIKVFKNVADMAIDFEGDMAISNTYILEQSNNQFITFIFPNPSKDILRIKTSKSLIKQIEIFNIFGSSVYKNLNINYQDDSLIHVEVKDFSTGIYFLCIDGICEKIEIIK